MSPVQSHPAAQPDDDAVLDEATARDTLVRWVANKAYWQKLIDDTVVDTAQFAGPVISAVLTRNEPLTRDTLLREAARQVSALLYAQCKSTEPLKREAGYEVLSQYLYLKALRLTERDEAISADATQQTLLSVFRFIHQANHPSTFTGWCFISLKRAINKLKIKDTKTALKEESLDEDDDEGDGAAAGDGPSALEQIEDESQPPVDEIISKDMEISDLQRCLAACQAINQRARELLKFIFEDGLTLGKIASLWKEKTNNVYQLYFRAKKALKTDQEFLQCLDNAGIAI